MFTSRPETNRHAKCHDGTETDPPGEFHDRQPARLAVKFGTTDPSNGVWQATQDGNDHKPNDHRDDVTDIITAPLRQHAGEENTEQRSISVAKNTEHDRNDPDIGMHNHQIGSG